MAVTYTPQRHRASTLRVLRCLLCPATIDASLVRPDNKHGWTFAPVRGSGLAVPICSACSAALAAERGEG